MSKNDTSKRSTWEKLNAQADHEKASPKSIEEKQETLSVTKPEPPQLAHPSYEELEVLLNKAEAERDEYKDRAIRNQAEIANTQNRSRQELENAYKYSLEKFIKELLPVKDHLEAALLSSTAKTKNDPLLTGVELTLKALQQILEKNGVKSVKSSIGDSFDPHFHEAVSAEESADKEPDTIIEVLQKGYLLHERLVRAASVKVAKAKESGS